MKPSQKKSKKAAQKSEDSLSTNDVFLELIEQARTEFREGKTLSLEEMKRAVLP
ncbi:MAG TPA: hypothetical protein VIA62_02640 [Thermoanaerobaculia bacterium]|nr:hypothetical protein [Thermoanaerobaculia bacterium]